jgi:hypothetical protein
MNRVSVIDYKSFKIGFAISTRVGHSGCPIIADGRIIAIHNGGGKKDDKFNVGRLVTFDLVGDLEEWGKQLHGHPIQIKIG